MWSRGGAEKQSEATAVAQLPGRVCGRRNGARHLAVRRRRLSPAETRDAEAKRGESSRLRLAGRTEPVLRGECVPAGSAAPLGLS